jgi:hypothetical protein
MRNKPESSFFAYIDSRATGEGGGGGMSVIKSGLVAMVAIILKVLICLTY